MISPTPFERPDLGLAEADPSRDLSGQDAADKLALVAHAIEATARGRISSLHGAAFGRTIQAAALHTPHQWRGVSPRGVVGLFRGEPVAAVPSVGSTPTIPWPACKRRRTRP